VAVVRFSTDKDDFDRGDRGGEGGGGENLIFFGVVWMGLSCVTLSLFVEGDIRW
jgi:hypothetical protein